MITVDPNEIRTRGAEFIRQSENDFFDRFLQACQKALSLIRERNAKVLALSGPSCSGKTTSSERLVDFFSRVGIDTAVISIDDFFRSFPAPGEIDEDDELPDFDSVSAIDLDAFSDCIDQISSGDRVYVPIYDFDCRRRCSMRRLDTEGIDLYIFEGIQAFYPEVEELLRHVPSVTMFVNVDDTLRIGEEEFSGYDLRLCRRICRDNGKRATEPSFTLRMWENVISNEKKNILPNAADADVKVSTLLPYGPCVLREELLRVLPSVPESLPEEKAEAERLIGLLSPLPSLAPTLVPPGSLFREFLDV